MHALIGDGTWNLGMRPDQESNAQPFGVWYDSPTNWATLARTTVEIILKMKLNQEQEASSQQMPTVPLLAFFVEAAEKAECFNRWL